MGTRWNRLVEAVPTSNHNLCLEQKYENFRIFLSENFHFLVVKFSVYLNRRVFVMDWVPLYNVQCYGIIQIKDLQKNIKTGCAIQTLITETHLFKYIYIENFTSKN